MAAGVELPEGRTGIVMEFPVGDEESPSSPVRLPKRLRRRLLDTECKSPSTVEEIEAKLRDADLRRQVSIVFTISFLKTVFVWLVRKLRDFNFNIELIFCLLVFFPFLQSKHV